MTPRRSGRGGCRRNRGGVCSRGRQRCRRHGPNVQRRADGDVDASRWRRPTHHRGSSLCAGHAHPEAVAAEVPLDVRHALRDTSRCADNRQANRLSLIRRLVNEQSMNVKYGSPCERRTHAHLKRN